MRNTNADAMSGVKSHQTFLHRELRFQHWMQWGEQWLKRVKRAKLRIYLYHNTLITYIMQSMEVPYFHSCMHALTHTSCTYAALPVSGLIHHQQLRVEGFFVLRWLSEWPKAFKEIAQWIQEVNDASWH